MNGFEKMGIAPTLRKMQVCNFYRFFNIDVLLSFSKT